MKGEGLSLFARSTNISSATPFNSSDLAVRTDGHLRGRMAIATAAAPGGRVPTPTPTPYARAGDGDADGVLATADGRS